MNYFKKGESFYYKIDADTFTIYEAFESNNQKRIMLNSSEAFYTDVMNRIEKDSFIETNEVEFTAFLNNVKSFL